MSAKPECSIISRSALGQDLLLGECQVLTSILSVVELKDGEVLVNQGADDNALYILAKGSIKVLSGSTVIYVMNEGECAGTRAFVDRAARKATLQSSGESIVYTMRPGDFEMLINAHPQMVYKVMRNLFRLTHSNLMRTNQEREALSHYISSTGRKG